MGRLYSVPINAVSVSAAQDLFNLTATSGMAFAVHSIELGQKTLTAWEAKEVKFIRHAGTITAGSGGTTVTPQKMNNGDAAATFTAHANDTTAMSSTSSAVILARDWEFLNGFFWMPAPEQRPIIAISQAFALNLPSPPSASMVVSGVVVVEELF